MTAASGSCTSFAGNHCAKDDACPTENEGGSEKKSFELRALQQIFTSKEGLEFLMTSRAASKRQVPPNPDERPPNLGPKSSFARIHSKDGGGGLQMHLSLLSGCQEWRQQVLPGVLTSILTSKRMEAPAGTLAKESGTSPDLCRARTL